MGTTKRSEERLSPRDSKSMLFQEELSQNQLLFGRLKEL